MVNKIAGVLALIFITIFFFTGHSIEDPNRCWCEDGSSVMKTDINCENHEPEVITIGTREKEGPEVIICDYDNNGRLSCSPIRDSKDTRSFYNW
jgi:hypothetical protein